MQHDKQWLIDNCPVQPPNEWGMTPKVVTYTESYYEHMMRWRPIENMPYDDKTKLIKLKSGRRFTGYWLSEHKDIVVLQVEQIGGQQTPVNDVEGWMEIPE